MKIKKTEIDNLNTIITLEIESDDYQKEVNEKLKIQQKKAQMKGFRTGKVPIGLVKKMHGNSILAEELNNIISKNLTKYISDNNLNILGEPLPSEKDKKPIDLENDKQFSFSFDIGLSPDFEIDIKNQQPVNYYKVKVDKAMIDSQIEQLTNKFADNQKVNKVGEKDFIKVDLVENKVKEPISKNDAVISIQRIDNQQEKNKLIGKQSGDIIKLDMKKSFKNHTDLATLLSVKKENLDEITPIFTITIKEINRLIPAKVDEKLFEKLYGKDQKLTLEKFNNRIKEELNWQWERNSFYKFTIDIKDKLIKKTTLDLPEKFLKRWLITVNKKIDKEEIEKNFEHSLNDIRWTLIRNKIIKKEKIEVSEKEIKEYAKHQIKMQYIQYGIKNFSEQDIATYANQLLKNSDENFKIKNQLLDNKVFSYFKEAIPLQIKKVSQQEFTKLTNPKN